VRGPESLAKTQKIPGRRLNVWVYFEMSVERVNSRGGLGGCTRSQVDVVHALDVPSQQAEIRGAAGLRESCGEQKLTRRRGVDEHDIRRLVQG